MEEEVRNEASNADEAQTEARDDGAAAGQSQTSADDLTDELFRELSVLGSRFVDVVQTAWDSDERKRIEADLKEGLNSVAESLEEGFVKVRDNEQTKDVLDKADNVAESVGEKVRSSEAAQELGNSLLRGLHTLAGQLEKWTEEMTAKSDAVDGETGAGATSASEDEAQDIPIDQG